MDALLAVPDRTTWHGRRDHASLLLTVQTGLRVSTAGGDLTSNRPGDVFGWWPQPSHFRTPIGRMYDEREPAKRNRLVDEGEAYMHARLNNPADLLPEAGKGIGAIYSAVHSAGVDPAVLELVHLRTSQINACGPCVIAGSGAMRSSGQNEDRVAAVAAWRETPYFSDAERAALALAEASTRLADRADAVPDEIWDEAAKHFDANGLAAVVLWIGMSNLFNRLNVTTRQQPRQSWG